MHREPANESEGQKRNIDATHSRVNFESSCTATSYRVFDEESRVSLVQKRAQRSSVNKISPVRSVFRLSDSRNRNVAGSSKNGQCAGKSKEVVVI